MKKYVCIECDFYISVKENENQSNVYICPKCTQIMKREIEIEHIYKEECIPIHKNDFKV